MHLLLASDPVKDKLGSTGLCGSCFTIGFHFLLGKPATSSRGRDLDAIETVAARLRFLVLSVLTESPYDVVDSELRAMGFRGRSNDEEDTCEQGDLDRWCSESRVAGTKVGAEYRLLRLSTLERTGADCKESTRGGSTAECPRVDEAKYEALALVRIPDSSGLSSN